MFGLRLLPEEASLISASVATTARASLVLSDLIVLIVTMHQTFHTLLSFADPGALTQYRSERSGVERDMWENVIQGAMDQDNSVDVMIRVIESGLENASYDIFLTFYSSCAQNRSGGSLRGISGHPPAGAQCRWNIILELEC